MAEALEEMSEADLQPVPMTTGHHRIKTHGHLGNGYYMAASTTSSTSCPFIPS
jgi:hypothetical protein